MAEGDVSEARGEARNSVRHVSFRVQGTIVSVSGMKIAVVDPSIPAYATEYFLSLVIKSLSIHLKKYDWFSAS